VSTLIQDIRYGFRMVVKSPGFTAVAVLSLALGIGANTTIFSLVNTLLLRPLPAERPEELVMVYTSDYSGTRYGSSSYPDYLDFREKNDALADLLASSPQSLTLTAGGQAERIFGELVTGNYFDLLGLEASLGRTFLPEEDRTPGTHPIVVLSHGLWQRRFGADPDLIGDVLLLNGQPYTVVGIGPEGFSGLSRMFTVELWVPMMMQPQLAFGSDRLNQRSTRGLSLIGRLEPGATVEQAQASFTVLASQLKEAYGRQWLDLRQDGRRITVVPESEARVPPHSQADILTFLGLLMSVVGLVLLIACANIANLLLARATGRRKEIAIRLSLGAGRLQLIRQLLTESILLSSLGGAMGFLLAIWTSGLLLAFKPPLPLPITLDLQLDTRVLGFTALLSVCTGIVFGLAPALYTSKPELVSSLKDELGTLAGGYRRSRLRSCFVVAQIGLSLLLLIGSGLFLLSLRSASTIDPGFDPDNIALMSIDLRLSGYTEPAGGEFYRQLLENVRALPGVESASLAEATPLSLFGSRRRIHVEGYESQPGEDMEFHHNVVMPDYFETLHIPLAAGRSFTSGDRAGAAGVVIVNETFARRFWPVRNPIGRRLSVTGQRGEFLDVIGVARDGKYNTLGEDPLPFYYLPAGQHYRSDMTLMVRTVSDPKNSLTSLRGEIEALDRKLPITGVTTMVEHMGISLFPARMAGTLLGTFGLLALVLAAVGIYGIMSFSVSQRTHEIGIRMALGAGQGDVLQLVVGHGLLLAVMGIAIGLAAAFALTRFLSSMLYGVSATDTLTFVGVPIVLIMVTLFASYIPARRATRVNPTVALRYE